MIGTVYLVGAGPGDPDLITRKGLKLIQTADVIIYDRLIPTELLEDARQDAILIYAGKAPTKHRLNQDEINNEIVLHALSGRSVVRLKGGDPFVFGRGGEEAQVCTQNGIPFEIIPGISSSYAVPAYAGIPLTHRKLTRSFTVITGHCDFNEGGYNDSPPDKYKALAELGGTLVILMGVKKLAHHLSKLIEAGLSPDTPAGIIEWGATSRQRFLEGTASTLPDLAADAEFKPPSVIVIGEVVRLRHEGIEWLKGELEHELLT